MSNLIWGTGSKARVINEYLKELNGKGADFFFDKYCNEIEFQCEGILINNENELIRLQKSVTDFIVCIGNTYGYERYSISKVLETNFLWNPIEIIDSNNFIDKTVRVGKGCQILPGAVINKFVKIGDYNIINCNSTIDHECSLGNGIHIMGSSAITGKVVIEDFVTVGTNATILPGIKIGEGSIIGAGSVITKNVDPYSVYAGVPGKKIKDIKKQENINDVEIIKKLLYKV